MIKCDEEENEVKASEWYFDWKLIYRFKDYLLISSSTRLFVYSEDHIKNLTDVIANSYRGKLQDKSLKTYKWNWKLRAKQIYTFWEDVHAHFIMHKLLAFTIPEKISLNKVS